MELYIRAVQIAARFLYLSFYLRHLQGREVADCALFPGLMFRGGIPTEAHVQCAHSDAHITFYFHLLWRGGEDKKK